MVKVKIPLLPQQREFLQSKEKMVAIYSSRACGKSFVLVLLTLLKMMDGQHVIYGVQNLDAWDKGPRVHLERFLDIFGIRDACTMSAYFQHHGDSMSKHFLKSSARLPL